MMYWYGAGMSGWGYAFMTVSMILFWGLIIVGIVALVRYLGSPGQSRGAESRSSTREQSTPERPTPEQLLAERFARGEIDEDEYRRRLGVMRGDRPLVAKP